MTEEKYLENLENKLCPYIKNKCLRSRCLSYSEIKYTIGIGYEIYGSCKCLGIVFYRKVKSD